MLWWILFFSRCQNDFLVDKSKVGRRSVVYSQSLSVSVVDVSFESSSFIVLYFLPPVKITRYLMSSSENDIEHNISSIRDRMAVCNVMARLTYLINPIDTPLCVDNLVHISDMLFLHRSDKMILSPLSLKMKYLVRN